MNLTITTSCISQHFLLRGSSILLFFSRLFQNPVCLANLGDFGSPEFVADKLLQAERCKETKKEEEEIGNQERRRRRMSDEQSDSAMMNPWDISDPCDMIDFYADEPPQFQFESPPLPEPVWNGDENNVGDPQPQPCAMDVSVNQPPQPVIDDGFPEAMKRTEHSWGSPSSGYQPHQSQPQSCAIDVCGNQPPQLPSQPPQLPPQPQPQPWSWPGSQPRSGPRSQPWSRSRPRLLSEPRPQSETDIVRTATDEFFADTCGYPPSQPQPQPQPQPQTEWDTRNMLELIPDVGGHQPLQPQPPVWTWEENKAFESVITSCFQDALRNHWEEVAARLPGRTPAQLQERFQKLINDISAIHNGYPTNTPLNASDNMTIMMEYNPLSIPIINPPPLPPYSTDHHNREEVLPAAEEEVVPTAEEEAAPTNSGCHWTLDEHRLFLRGYEEEGKHWKRISEYYVKTKTSSQIASHAQKYFKHQKDLAKGKKLRKSIFDVI
ncbi:hypothetical protein HN51_045772 [Arachis hypogaea]